MSIWIVIMMLNCSVSTWFVHGFELNLLSECLSGVFSLCFPDCNRTVFPSFLCQFHYLHNEIEYVFWRRRVKFLTPDKMASCILSCCKFQSLWISVLHEEVYKHFFCGYITMNTSYVRHLHYKCFRNKTFSGSTSLYINENNCYILKSFLFIFGIAV